MNADDRDEPETDDRPRRRRREYDDDRRPVPKRSSTTTILLIVGGVFLAMIVVFGGMIALLLPAVSKLRDSAARSKSQNNMKLIVLGQHNFEASGGGFMGPFAVDSTSGVIHTNHSWRTGLLPYIGQGGLHQGIDLNQAWDAPRNSQFTNIPVREFQDPTPGNNITTATPYRCFVGGGAVFTPDGKPVPINSVSDGTSNTFLFVEAFDTVPWAQPKELTYSTTAPLPKLGSAAANRGGFNAAMADGSVRFIRNTVSDATLRKYIEKADGQLITEE